MSRADVVEAKSLTLTAVPGLPLVQPGDDLASIIAESIRRCGIVPVDGDVIAVAQKIVSKAEGRYVRLADVKPSSLATQIASDTAKDPRIVEVILSESAHVIRHRPGLLITEHRLGFVMANAGVDQSNLEPAGDDERVLMLPIDPDASCARLKAALDDIFDCDLAVVINDSFGRPWRNGVVGVALGAAGLPSLIDRVGAPDLFGRPMRVTQVALADELAAAASMLMGQTDEGRPVVHVRGLEWTAPVCNARALIRDRAQDLFR